MITELLAWMDERLVGRLKRDRRGKLTFAYADEWRNAPGAYPLSLSMPLTLAEHGQAVIDAYVWGLLPDNELILERWARRFHVSARNAFALLLHVGEDCAGAIRFVAPDRVAHLANEPGTIDWLTEQDVVERLAALREDASAWRRTTDTGQFSLAGAQPKTALYFDGARWGVPSGRIPTTHILKPGAPGLDGHAENEHFCLSLARELGLPVAPSRVGRFGNEVAVVLERYDRVRTGQSYRRVHQEDICQALGLHPSRKYQNEAGPTPRDIVALLRGYSDAPDEDVATFVEALAFNWLVAGTDAHAKNYSILLGTGGRVRLAPLYDLASALPYARTQSQKLALAMSIGGKYRLRDIGSYQWEKLSAELELDWEPWQERLARMANALPDLAQMHLRRAHEDGLSHPVLAALAEAIARRCAKVSFPRAP